MAYAFLARRDHQAPDTSILDLQVDGVDLIAKAEQVNVQSKRPHCSCFFSVPCSRAGRCCSLPRPITPAFPPCSDPLRSEKLRYFQASCYCYYRALMNEDQRFGDTPVAWTIPIKKLTNTQKWDTNREWKRGNLAGDLQQKRPRKILVAHAPSLRYPMEAQSGA